MCSRDSSQEISYGDPTLENLGGTYAYLPKKKNEYTLPGISRPGFKRNIISAVVKVNQCDYQTKNLLPVFEFLLCFKRRIRFP